MGHEGAEKRKGFGSQPMYAPGSMEIYRLTVLLLAQGYNVAVTVTEEMRRQLSPSDTRSIWLSVVDASLRGGKDVEKAMQNADRILVEYAVRLTEWRREKLL